jgi:glucosamine--fructose-6-phosphate aminotransferase (isomerizing)
VGQVFSDIHEQAGIVARMAADVSSWRNAIQAAKTSGCRFVIFAARGASHNAALYGKYLAATRAGLPAGLAIPSAATLYGAKIDLRSCLVIGISQSGHTPDVLDYVGEARQRGAFTVAVTDDEASPIAGAADVVVPTHAGAEENHTATKTYTSHVAALALFWAAWSGDDKLIAALRDDVPAAMESVAELEAKIKRIAPRYRSREHLVTVARGYNYGTAMETALQLRETCHLFAAAYSGADLMHGQIAGIESGLPAIAFVLPGKAHGYMTDVVRQLKRRGLDLLVVGPRGAATELATVAIELPVEVPEPVSPLVSILPAQLLAYHLCKYMGLDPDHPEQAGHKSPLI